MITRHLDSVGALDLVLLLHGERDRAWSLVELCSQVGCPVAWAERQLEQLGRLMLVGEVGPSQFQFRRDAHHGPTVDELARACRCDRAAVTRRIFREATSARRGNGAS
jgi:hypothetical protein